MNRSIIKLLEWDTSFFGFKTGIINITRTDKNKLKQILNESKKDGYRLLYGIIDPGDTISNQSAQDLKGFLADEKTTFTKKVINKNSEIGSSNIIEYNSSIVDISLLSLAFQSGEYSRFKTDKNFSVKQFENLYTQWIINSINKTIADKIFICKEENEIIGFVTIKINFDIGKIGLIAVDSEKRGKSIGNQLIEKVELYLNKNNIKQLDVVTQKNNEAACKFYLKNGFNILKVENIYHFWNS